MIHQISHVKTKTEPLPTINRDLLKTRRIQAHVRELAADRLAPTEGYLFSPINAGPYLVPITRWIE
jgi:hypothetical protein